MKATIPITRQIEKSDWVKTLKFHAGSGTGNLPATDGKRILKVLNKLLKNYREDDFALQQKARVLAAACLSVLCTLPAALIDRQIITFHPANRSQCNGTRPRQPPSPGQARQGLPASRSPAGLHAPGFHRWWFVSSTPGDSRDVSLRPVSMSAF